MKIGIITYWESDDNYGQILQCYALQEYLRNRGHYPFLIRYSPSDEMVPLKYRICSLMNAGRLVNSLVTRIQNRSKKDVIEAQKRTIRELNKKRHFEDFKAGYIEMSDVVYTSIDELKKNPPQADIYITGSDQVWHDSLHLSNVAGWYLQFGNPEIKRYSYAASMGRKLQKSEEKLFVKYLQAFNGISVREKGVKELCSNLGYESKLVVGPTMLLNGDSYRVLEQVVETKHPYSLIYSINVHTKEDIYGDELLDYIHSLGEDVRFISSSGYEPAHKLFESVPIFPATIPEWIYLIDNASTIFTTSFHGVVFSILLKKAFYWIPLKGRSAKGNDRILDMLSKLNLMNRVLNNPEKLYQEKEMISWDEVYRRLAVLREESVAFIDSFSEEKK